MSYIIVSGSIGSRQLVGLLGWILVAFALALEVVPLVFGLVAALSYIIHQRSVDVARLHCTITNTLRTITREYLASMRRVTRLTAVSLRATTLSTSGERHTLKTKIHSI